MDSVWRLVWALPLVLAVGFVAVLLLKRYGLPAVKHTPPEQRMSLRESLSLSDGTRTYLIEIDRTPYLLVESTRQTLLQPMPTKAADVARPAWLQRLQKQRS